MRAIIALVLLISTTAIGGEAKPIHWNEQIGVFQNAHCGPLSYVAPEALSFLDNGFHGSTSDSEASNGQTGGLVQLLFEAG